MAVAFDNADGAQGTGASSLETSAWTIAGSDRLLVAGMGWSAGSPPTYSAIKWGGSGGVSLTQVGSTLSQGFGRLALARLIAPSASSAVLRGELSGSADEFCVGGVSFTGAHQTTPLGTAITNTGNGSSPVTATANNVVSDTNEMVVSAAFSTQSASGTVTVAVGSGQTQRWEEESIGAFSAGTQSTEPGASSVNMTEVFTASGGTADWMIFGVSVKASGIDNMLAWITA